MFQGETAITVDDKGRVTVPTVYRDLVARESGNRLVLTYNPFVADGLLLYRFDTWEALRDKLLALPNMDKTVRILQQKLVGSAAILELDGNGRISLPPSHRSAVGIEKRAVLMGMGDKFELWSEQAHRAQVSQVIDSGDLTGNLQELRL